MQITGEQTVSSILKGLEEKYAGTRKEKAKNLTEKIVEFRVEREEIGEKVRSKLERMVSDVESFKLRGEINYCIAQLFIARCFQARQLNEQEK